MVLNLIALIIILLSLSLPLKHAFGIALFTSFLFIVPNGQAINSYCILIVFGRLLISRFSLKKSTITVDRFCYLILAYLVFGLVSAIVFQGKDASEYLRRAFMTIVTIISLVSIYKNINDYDLFIKYNILGLLLIALHLYTQVFIPINPFAEATFTSQGRIEPSGMSGQYVSPNLWGFYIIALFGSISSYLILFKKRILSVDRAKSRRYVHLFIALIILVAPLIGLLASRSVFIIFLIVVLICSLNMTFYKTFIISLVLGLLIGIFNVTLKDQLLNYANTLPESNVMKPLIVRVSDVDQESQAAKLDSRSYLAEMGFRIFLDHPLFGVGLGNEKRSFALPQYYGSQKVSHNTYISLPLELGLFGILFLLAVILLWIKYIHLPFIWCILAMLGLYAAVHGIMLLTLPWLIMSFFNLLLRHSHLKHADFKLLQ